MYYIIKENGLAHILNESADGYVEFQFGQEPKDLEDALLLEVTTESKILDYKKYLSSTDWYYTRQLETGEEVPADVVTKRLEARAYIREVEDGK